VPSLIDQAGYFYRFEDMPAFLAQVRLDQLEWRAQIEVVLAAGLMPTHLESKWALRSSKMDEESSRKSFWHPLS
jgi:hypothetical protein